MLQFDIINIKIVTSSDIDAGAISVMLNDRKVHLKDHDVKDIIETVKRAVNKANTIQRYAQLEFDYDV